MKKEGLPLLLFFPLLASYIPVLQGKEARQMEGCLLLMAVREVPHNIYLTTPFTSHMQFLPTFS